MPQAEQLRPPRQPRIRHASTLLKNRGWLHRPRLKGGNMPAQGNALGRQRHDKPLPPCGWTIDFVAEKCVLREQIQSLFRRSFFYGETLST